ncbi:hypothetical protein [Mesorhizobium sp.]|uniref:hypothetical protein n=1 Tax=Mesorhizobium sp. TaxID=1871066 RepID=UPI000FE91A27|nr:hypothetical protein [Mesorhizobium sp.]RWO88606.1 MAG: hypothetical protein EOQ95_18580 [Mesorhizobium sp.]
MDLKDFISARLWRFQRKALAKVVSDLKVLGVRVGTGADKKAGAANRIVFGVSVRLPYGDEGWQKRSTTMCGGRQRKKGGTQQPQKAVGVGLGHREEAGLF